MVSISDELDCSAAVDESVWRRKLQQKYVFSISSKQNAEYLLGKVIEVPSHLREVGLEINVYCFHRIVFLQRQLRRSALPALLTTIEELWSPIPFCPTFQPVSASPQSLSVPSTNLSLSPSPPLQSYWIHRASVETPRGKYQPKMTRVCDWPFRTKSIIVCDSFFIIKSLFVIRSNIYRPLSFMVITNHSQNLLA